MPEVRHGKALTEKLARMQKNDGPGWTEIQPDPSSDDSSQGKKFKFKDFLINLWDRF